MGHKKKKNLSFQDELTNKVLKIFAGCPSKSFNYKQISHQLNLADKGARLILGSLLIDLMGRGAIKEVKKGKFQINPALVKFHSAANSFITGRVDMKYGGKAYIVSDDIKEDIFIAPGNTNHALHGDLVKVFIFPKTKSKRSEGEIVEILERSKINYVGVLNKSGKSAIVIPDNNTAAFEIYIPRENLNNALDGHKVIAEITDWPQNSKNPVGKILLSLGEPGDNNVEMNAILAELGFPLRFSSEVIGESERIAAGIPEKEYLSRRDFKNVVTFTIDPEDAKDFDDALSLQYLPNGNFEVGVHIADVSYYVTPGCLIDEEACLRGTSVYLVDRVVPMLPERLSNGLCSLSPNTDKCCFSAVFEMTNKAVIKNTWFGKTIINSDKRFNYSEAQQVIETGKGEFSKELLQLQDLAVCLRNERFKNGSFAFETQEVKFTLDENGKPLGVKLREYKDSNKLIEEFMLLANRQVAELIGKKKSPEAKRTFVYRVHDEPNPEKLQVFSEFVSKLGYSLKGFTKKTTNDAFNKLLSDVAGKSEQNIVENLAIRTMAKAFYSTDNIGHYGLSFSHYTHFTSPIRRYPDLMVHRLLQDYLEDKQGSDKRYYEEKCKHSSEMEKKAAEAERASVKYKQVEFMADKIGRVFDGIISGVSKWGFFVEIIENKCEGMISLRDLQDDFYYLDEENYCIVGQRYGIVYKLGDKISIIVKRANMSRRQLDFGLSGKIK